jgi:hypothetical protein
MAQLWMPGAERQPEGNGGGMVGGPPRAVWHITWDRLGPGGKMPSFNAIAGYLKNVNYAPHIMWDPWTGRVVQFYAADESARALANASGGVETNRQGSRCIQVEVFFSPGAVVGGQTYKTVADTPCKGLGGIVDWMRSLGIPDVWPSGWPQWSGNSRSATTWKSKAGHYGHCHVPENDHTDPGPMPRGMFKEKNGMALTDADAAKVADAVKNVTYNLSGDKAKESWQAAKNFAEEAGPQLEEIFARIGRIDDNVQAILSIVSGGPVIGGPE